MTDKQLIVNVFEAPWIFEDLNNHELKKIYSQAQQYLVFWKKNPHQSVTLSTAIAQHQYALRLIKHIMNLASNNS